MTAGSTLASLGVGVVAGTLAHRYRIPGGAITWSLLAVAVLHLLNPGLPPLDPVFRVIAQIMIGIVIGSGLHRAPFRMMRRVVWPVVVTVVGILGAAIVAAFALASLTELSLFGALLSVIPGGSSDVTAVALELDQDVAIVAGFQMVRQLAIFSVVVTLFQVMFRDPPPRVDEPDG